MHSSKIIRPSDEEFKRILDFEPKKVGIGIPEVAETFMGEQPPPLIEPFKLDELVAKQTGVYESEKSRVEQKIDDKAIEKLRDIQEKAYKEAYDLGLEEGRKRAYESNNEKIGNQLNELSDLTNSIREMKKNLMDKNEALLVDLVYHCAEKVVMEHVDKKNDILVNTLKEVIRSLDSKENIVVKLSEEDLAVINHLIGTTNPNLDFLQKIKFIGTQDISKGGCIIETDHGLVDATLEERFKKLWTVLNETKPAGT